MRMTAVSKEVAIDALHNSAHTPLFELYKKVCINYDETLSARNWSCLWSRLAPNGNIYRLLGFEQERLRHCHDLGVQLSRAAEEHAELLGGASLDLDARRQRLLRLLNEAEPRGADSAQDLEGAAGRAKGFLPLQEFLGDEAVNVCGMFFVPRGPEAWALWKRNHLLAWLVAFVQLIAPTSIIMHTWQGQENPLRHPRALWQRLTLEEFKCLGADQAAATTTVLGTVLIFIVLTIIMNYTSDEIENARKQGRLPLDNFWGLLNTLANASSCLLISIAIPLELWGEDGATGLIMNSMAMLFIFVLDDLTADAFRYLGEDDSSFQQRVGWNYALLSQCPVELRDLLDPEAKREEDLWKVRFDSAGRLLAAADDRVAQPLCLTRVAPVQRATEADPLVKGEDGEADTLAPATAYRVRANGRVWHLPGRRATVIQIIWAVVWCLLSVIWWVVPMVWFTVNKACTGNHH